MTISAFKKNALIGAILILAVCTCGYGFFELSEGQACCLIGAYCGVVLPVQVLEFVAPMVPDYHVLFTGTEVRHGIGWKLPFGVTFLDADYTESFGFYLFSPRLNFGDVYNDLAGFNALRLEILPEIILTNLDPGLLYGISGRVYVPVVSWFSVQAEGGVLFQDTVLIPHAGIGAGLYFEFSSIGYSGPTETIFSVVVTHSFLFLPAGSTGGDLEIDIKFRLFY
ncbi:MAG: hypothetical protein JW904_05365 [Spirochaetales bacterium]|nr:hypothetical protein [Spirochaetales bacterium]